MFKLTYDKTTNILQIKLDITISSDDLIQSFVHEVHKAIDEFDKNNDMNKLFDATNFIVPDIDYDNVIQFTKITNEYNKHYPNTKIAIVAATDLMFGEMRIHEVYCDELNIEHYTCRNVDEAIKWLTQ